MHLAGSLQAGGFKQEASKAGGVIHYKTPCPLERIVVLEDSRVY